MKKYFNIFLVFVIAFFTMPMSSHTVLADTGDNSLAVPDEAYTIKYNTDSQMIQEYFGNTATLLHKNDVQYIQMNGSSGQLINSLTINGEEVTWGELKDDGTFTVQFEVDGALSEELNFGMEVDIAEETIEPNVSLSFDEATKQSVDTDDYLLLPIDNNAEEANEEEELGTGNTGESDEEGSNSDNVVEPEYEEENDSGSTDESKNEEGNLLGTENNPTDDSSPNDTDSELIPEESFDKTDSVYFVTDSDATNRYFENPVTLFYKDGQKYIQMDGTGGQFIKSLKINGKEVLDGVEEDGTFTIQFELDGALSDELDFGMIIDPPIPSMDEQTFNVSLSFTELIPEEAFDESESVYYVTDSDNTKKYFENPVTLFSKDDQKYIQMDGTSGQFIDSLTINEEEVKWGEVQSDGTFTIQFELEGALSDELDFGMIIAPPIPGVDEQTFDVSLSFVKAPMGSGGTPGNSDETDEGDGSEDDEDTEVINGNHSELIPDKAFTIEYEIQKEDGAESVSNELFVKPALLLEKDNNKYVQLTINNGQMVKDLSNKYGDVLLVEENTDGSIIVQFKVDNDLSDMLLSMRIVVDDDIPGSPGELNADAFIVFDKGSIEEISAGDHMLVGTNDLENENGPYIEDPEAAGDTLSSDNPEKPELGQGEDNNDPGAAGEQGTNPKTGDTANIMLYILLLIGSAIPLALQLKKRFT